MMTLLMNNIGKPTIKSVQFGLFSPVKIKQHSVLHVQHPETLENGMPKESGLSDPRMGVIDNQLLCSTCNLNCMECQGHFGHIELCKPVFHVNFLNRIKKVLETVCFYCSSIKNSKTDNEEQKNSDSQMVKSKSLSTSSGNESTIGKSSNGTSQEESMIRPQCSIPKTSLRNALNKVWAANKTKFTCDVCGNKQPIIRKEGMNLLAFMKNTDTEGKVILTAEKAYGILKKISDEDIVKLGFDIEHSRPEWMILTTLLVSPPSCRPAVQMDNLRGEDDLTHKYADIIKANNNLRRYETEGAPSHILRDYEQLLQFHVATLMDNEISGQPQALQKNGRPLKSLSARLKGKEGRLRYNLMGKRVDFSARTVITPDPNISLDEVGIPFTVAMTHTFSEHVNLLNIDYLRELVNNGPSKHPGANYVIRTDGQRIDLRFNRSDVNLQVGYVVERHLKDGDIVLFNRQPSLHKMSMMAHRVRVMQKKTFRLNLSVTTPYNADFDGDEMNLHAPQGLLSAVELRQLASVTKQVVSPQSNKPVMGIVQDSLIGVRRLTSDNSFIELKDAMQIYYTANLHRKDLEDSGNMNSLYLDQDDSEDVSELNMSKIGGQSGGKLSNYQDSMYENSSLNNESKYKYDVVDSSAKYNAMQSVDNKSSFDYPNGINVLENKDLMNQNSISDTGRHISIDNSHNKNYKLGDNNLLHTQENGLNKSNIVVSESSINGDYIKSSSFDIHYNNDSSYNNQSKRSNNFTDKKYNCNSEALNPINFKNLPVLNCSCDFGKENCELLTSMNETSDGLIYLYNDPENVLFNSHLCINDSTLCKEAKNNSTINERTHRSININARNVLIPFNKKSNKFQSDHQIYKDNEIKNQNIFRVSNVDYHDSSDEYITEDKFVLPIKKENIFSSIKEKTSKKLDRVNDGIQNASYNFSNQFNLTDFGGKNMNNVREFNDIVSNEIPQSYNRFQYTSNKSTNGFTKTRANIFDDNITDMPRPTILRPVVLYTGKQIFSWSLPKINLKTKSTDDRTVLIVDGNVHQGVIDKKSVGTVEGGIIHVIYNDFGSNECRKFFDSLQKIVCTYMAIISSFSVGIGDTVPSKTLKEHIDESIDAAISEVQKIIDDPTTLQRLPGMSLRESFESCINMSLNKARNISGNCAQKELRESNNVKQMVLAGSKGSIINISQMTACVGQQNMEGKRIPFGFRNRTLPHFCKDDYGARSKGFVRNSYLLGLTPEEFYFHAMGGREGLIDTAVKTAETGYIQRRLVKAMEDLKISFDGSVRSGNGSLTQFMYGDDGLCGENIERCRPFQYNEMEKALSKVKKDALNNLLDNNNITSQERNNAGENIIETQSQEVSLNNGKINNLEVMAKILTLNAIPEIRKDFLTNNFLVNELEHLQSNKAFNMTYYMPVNLSRLIWNAKRFYETTLSNISIREYNSKMTDLLQFVEKSIIHFSRDKKIMEYLKAYLSLSNLLHNRINKKQFKYIINSIKDKLGRSIAILNEMVGTLAAQSVGEPATQMTLNTFHLAGVASTVTLGVPRLKEVINIAKTLKTPSMKLFPTEEYGKSMDDAKKAQILIEYAGLKDITEHVQVVYEPDWLSTVIEEDRDFVSTHFELADEAEVEKEQMYGSYVIRIVLDREKLLGKALLVKDVVESIEKICNKQKGKPHDRIDLGLRNTMREGSRIEQEQNTFFNDSNSLIHDSSQPHRTVFIQGTPAQKDASFVSIMASDENSELLVIRIRSMCDTQDEVMDLMEKIMSVHLAGYKNIKKVFIVEENNQFIFQTEGVNLHDLLSCPIIDNTKVYSNNIIEVCEVLGIEAAREVILKELRSVIENEGYVNIRHLMLLADVMTVNGILCGITRHGVNRNEKSALMRCSFEETVEILMEAAIIGEKTQCREVTECIILGQNVPIGTGLTELFIDIQKLKDAVEICDKDFELEVRSPNSGYSPIIGLWSPIPEDSPLGKAYKIESSPSHSTQGGYSPISAGYSPISPGYNTSPNATYSPVSPGYGTIGGFSPSSPSYIPASPSYTPSGFSPSGMPISGTNAYAPSSPTYAPSSPAYNSPFTPGVQSSAQNTVTSPSYTPSVSSFASNRPTNSSAFTPVSPAYSSSRQPGSILNRPMNLGYTPTSPSYNPSSTFGRSSNVGYTPVSPSYTGSFQGSAYRPSNLSYAPTSPSYTSINSMMPPKTPKPVTTPVTKFVPQSPTNVYESMPQIPNVEHERSSSVGAFVTSSDKRNQQVENVNSKNDISEFDLERSGKNDEYVHASNKEKNDQHKDTKKE
ncbi:hypothetical protein EDEG_01976 [Edhazardia aedis USNM 41457]|uniref:DNA-directed RNA polymerase subunit n=1 Tax=Edhazardia aedis (strain USNM 41457) TaxID=1003232 RepID=J8ZVP8_EDHAE|nr:hypothetical protein EDEG_01976 [Edhazardia aedis USNM 41457]|eukprot:EJW03738.1 hypothetical protein EDEG_01976 [Edhazardia aedis USNM 41457]